MSGPDNYELIQPSMPTIAIVGRPNVGKSALFNRIIGRRHAIVHESSGVTRDRVNAVTEWEGKRFMLVDTGGLGVLKGEKTTDMWNDLIRKQLQVALESADEVIMVVDAQTGLASMDEEVADLLRDHSSKVTVAANKADNEVIAVNAAEFKRLGFKPIIPVSCLHNRGVAELIDAATINFPTTSAADEKPLKVAIVGRPNVGKSSIVNRMLGEERVMVSDVAGTTRDAVDIPLQVMVDGQPRAMNLVDTAGLKRRTKVSDSLEYFSMARSEAALNRADVVVLVLDASDPATMQDKKIARKIADAGKPCLILLNKWDVASQNMKQKDLMVILGEDMAFMRWAKVQTCCALSGYNFGSILPTVFELASQLDVTIPTALVNRVVNDALMRMPAPVAGRGRFKVLYSLHTGNRPPMFILFANSKAGAKANYLGYLEGPLRRAFGLEGLPLKLEVRVRKEPEARATVRRARVKREEKTPEGKIEKRKRDKRNKRPGRR